MKIESFGQAGFIFEAKNGFRLAVDIGVYTPIEKLEGVRADAMFVSHIHSDHFSLEHIKKISPKKLYISNECKKTIKETILPEIIIIKAGDQIRVEENTTVDVFAADHGPNVSSSVEEGLGFIITMNEEKIYFPGDMFYPSGPDVSRLEIDYAFLPVGAFYTFGPREALAFAKTFKKIGKIIAMHERKKLELKEQFLELARETGFNAE